MLQDLGVTYCIIGHSERRNIFGETDDIVAKKLAAIMETNIIPILCVGESIEIRDANEYKEFVEMQLRHAFNTIDSRKVQKCIIAYEPIWAIGSGKTATIEQAQEMCEFIRYTIKKMFGEHTSETISILYGGSVNAGNVTEIMKAADIDGVLVGGASLKPEFIDMVLSQE